MMRHKSKYLILFILPIILISCKPEQTENEILNEWIWDGMTEIYLWADDISSDQHYKYADDPEDYFYSLKNENDRFSWIVDDYQALIDMFNNVELSNGISASFGLVGPNEVVALVEYVSEDSPADLKHIHRGDIIYKINDKLLDTLNYANLFYAEEQKLEFVELIDNALYPIEGSVSLSAVVVNANPVLHDTIITHANQNIAYLAYSNFTDGVADVWKNTLDAVFADFKSSNVDKIIIDLRYNPGGSISSATHLASMILPEDVIEKEKLFVSFQWNNLYQNYYIREQGEDSENLKIKLEKNPAHNLNLNEVCFLTTSHSASASELIIIGTDPYMNVSVVGEKTYGKCYGSRTLPDFEDPPRHNWAMQPIVIKYANADGYTDFHEGLIPHISVNDDLFNAKPFGDTEDPMIAAALEKLTGVAVPNKKSLHKAQKMNQLKDPIRNLKSTATFTPTILPQMTME